MKENIFSVSLRKEAKLPTKKILEKKQQIAVNWHIRYQTIKLKGMLEIIRKKLE